MGSEGLQWGSLAGGWPLNGQQPFWHRRTFRPIVVFCLLYILAYGRNVRARLFKALRRLELLGNEMAHLVQ